MSAYLVSPECVSDLAHELVRRGLVKGPALRLSRQMFYLNIGNLLNIYTYASPSACVKENLGYGYAEYMARLRQGADVKHYPLSEGRLLGMLSGFTYQCCDSRDIVKTELYQTLSKIESELGEIAHSLGQSREGWVY